MHNRISMMCLIAVFIGLLMAGTPALAAESAPASNPNMVFIIDSSGSMNELMDGTPKMDIAKEVMTGLIDALPDDVNAGLVAYGHRRKGDCNDIEELAPLAPINKPLFIEKTRSLAPLGHTPIARVLETTAEKLKTLEAETTIILVSDGQDTCGGDPLAVAQKLKAAGINFVLHVIGFGVTDADRLQLESLASAGGGKYYTAKNAGELAEAVQHATEEATGPRGPALLLGATENGKPAKIRFTISSAGKFVAQSDTTLGNPRRFYLEPGVYEVQAEDCWAAQRPVQTASIEYKGEELVYTFDFTAGVLSMRTLKNGAPSWAFVRVNRAGTDDKVTEKDTSLHNPLDIKLLPGIYDLEFFVQGQRTPVGKRENIEIKPGETTSLEFSF